MAFVEFDDDRDAGDALDRRHGWEFEGQRLRVEFSKPKGSDDRGRSRSRERPVLRDSWHRLKVSNMPETASWQDLKDFLRKARAQVKFTDVLERGVGVAGFASRDEVILCALIKCR